MSHTKATVLPVLLAPLTLAAGALAPLDDVPAFGPEEGLSVTKRVETEIQVSLDDMTMVVNGNEMDASMMEMEMDTSTSQVVAVTDRYVSVGEGRALKLERTFDELSSSTAITVSNAMMGQQESDLSGKSELEGSTVVFEWDDAAGEYTVEFGGDSDGDSELLEGLVADLDLLALLPRGAVAEGASWPVEPEGIRSVFAPSGSVKIEPEETEQMMGMGNNGTPSLNDALGEIEGEVSATFKGFRDEDGTRVAVIELEIDVSSANDLTEFVRESMSEADIPEGVEVEIDSFDMEFLFEGQGELLWNMDAGVFHALSISGETGQVIDTALNMAMGEMKQAMEQSMTLSGTQTVRMTADL